eukprot:8590409-Heterocapsa_arctica.AAC.1
MLPRRKDAQAMLRLEVGHVPLGGSHLVPLPSGDPTRPRSTHRLWAPQYSQTVGPSDMSKTAARQMAQ